MTSYVPAPNTGAAVITNVPYSVSLSGTGVPGDKVYYLLPSGQEGGGDAVVAADGTYSDFLYPGGFGLFSYLAVQVDNAYDGSAASPAAALIIGSPTNNTVQTTYSTRDLSSLFPQGYEFAMAGAVNYVTLLDGSISVGETDTESTIQRLYEGLLGRGVDTGALVAGDALYTSAPVPEAGPSATNPYSPVGMQVTARIATGILASAEYAALRGNDSNAQFVNSLFTGFLGRAPDAATANSNVAALNAGISRAALATNFADTLEATDHLLAQTNGIFIPNPAASQTNAVYQTGLGREVDAGTETGILNALSAGTPLLSIVQNIVGSAEFKADHLGQNNVALVASLYQNGLGRSPDVTGAAGFTNMLNAGAATAQVVLAIGTSSEALGRLTVNPNIVPAPYA